MNFTIDYYTRLMHRLGVWETHNQHILGTDPCPRSIMYILCFTNACLAGLRFAPCAMLNSRSTFGS